jgi:hypothetical protein
MEELHICVQNYHHITVVTGSLFVILISKMMRMKKIFFAGLLITGFMFGAFAQDVKEKDVPAAIQSSFKTEFPKAKDVEWKLKEGKYKVEFEINGLDHFAKYGTDGKLIARGMKIRTSELPNAVTTAIKDVYAARMIDDAYRVDKDGAAFYLVKLKGDPETKVLYTADGQVAKMDK